MLLKNYDEDDTVQDDQICLWKDPFYGMVWYAMLCYGMLWDFNAMLWDFCAYDVKDKHSATVPYV